MSTPVKRRTFADIGEGDTAIGRTIREMRRLAIRDAQAPAIRDLARRLKSGKSDRAAVRAAHEYVVRRIRYVKDPESYELVRAPIHTLVGSMPVGDCDCMVTALGALLLAMGYEVRFRVIAHRPDAPKDFTHVNCQAVLPSGEVIPLDPVMGMGGFNNEKSRVNRQRIWRIKDMKLVTLEDDVQATGGRSGGCNCGGRCGGRCKKGCGCGGSRGKHNHRSEFSPVVVNVNTGTQYSDESRVDFRDSSSRTTSTSNRSASMNMPALRQFRRGGSVPPPEAPAETPAEPVLHRGDIRGHKRTKRPNYIEFY